MCVLPRNCTCTFPGSWRVGAGVGVATILRLWHAQLLQRHDTASAALPFAVCTQLLFRASKHRPPLQSRIYTIAQPDEFSPAPDESPQGEIDACVRAWRRRVPTQSRRLLPYSHSRKSCVKPTTHGSRTAGWL